MKKLQVKLMDLDAKTDLEAELNLAGQLGWSFKHAVGTPQGMKFVLERTLDEEVTTAEINAEAEQIYQKELMKKFAI